jgi:hypothetical protein
MSVGEKPLQFAQVEKEEFSTGAFCTTSEGFTVKSMLFYPDSDVMFLNLEHQFTDEGEYKSHIIKLPSKTKYLKHRLFEVNTNTSNED